MTGSPGGSRIITTVLQIVMNVIDHGMNIAEATAPRMHHQWLPDELRSRRASALTRSGCSRQKGHKVASPTMGSTQSIVRSDHGGSSAPPIRAPRAGLRSFTRAVGTT